MWGLPGWGADSISCRQLHLPVWAWLQSEATSLLLKSDSFHKEETVLEWCLLPSDRIILARSVWEGRWFFRHMWKVHPQRLCVCLCHLQNYAGHYRQATKRWSHDFQCVHPRVQPTLPGEQRQNIAMPKGTQNEQKGSQYGVFLSIKEGEKSKLAYDSSSVICSNPLKPIFQIALLRKSRRKRRKRAAPVFRLFAFT